MNIVIIAALVVVVGGVVDATRPAAATPATSLTSQSQRPQGTARAPASTSHPPSVPQAATVPVARGEHGWWQQQPTVLPSVHHLFHDVFWHSPVQIPGLRHPPRFVRLHPLSSLNSLLPLCDPMFRQTFAELYLLWSQFARLDPEFLVEHEPVPARAYTQSEPYRLLRSSLCLSHLIIQVGVTRTMVFVVVPYRQPASRPGNLRAVRRPSLRSRGQTSAVQQHW